MLAYFLSIYSIASQFYISISVKCLPMASYTQTPYNECHNSLFYLSITKQGATMSIPAYDDSNIFAKILAGDIPSHKVYEDDRTLAFMDIMPQAKGHVLVIPKQQAVELSDLEPEYAQAVLMAAKKVMQAQRKVLNREGIVQMQLNGSEAGQTVPHYHVHLVPTSIHELGKHGLSNNQADQAELAELAKQFADAID